jgi:hypothetical protein
MNVELTRSDLKAVGYKRRMEENEKKHKPLYMMAFGLMLISLFGIGMFITDSPHNNLLLPDGREVVRQSKGLFGDAQYIIDGQPVEILSVGGSPMFNLSVGIGGLSVASMLLLTGLEVYSARKFSKQFAEQNSVETK